MLAASRLLVRWRVDDAVGAVPVHLGAGIWGTLAVALFGQPLLLATGLGFWDQLAIQVVGITTCGAWTFGIVYLISWVASRFLCSEGWPRGRRNWNQRIRARSDYDAAGFVPCGRNYHRRHR